MQLFPPPSSLLPPLPPPLQVSNSTMVVLANPALDQIPLLHAPKYGAHPAAIPTVDLSKPGAAEALVKACEDFGFFKVINHGIPLQLMHTLEAAVLDFFSLPQAEKEMSGPANPFGYGNKRIGPNGDIGWVEYLLFLITSKSSFPWPMVFPDDSSAASFRLISQRGVERVPDGGEEVGRRGARIDGARAEDEAEGCAEQDGDGRAERRNLQVESLSAMSGAGGLQLQHDGLRRAHGPTDHLVAAIEQQHRIADSAQGRELGGGSARPGRLVRERRRHLASVDEWQIQEREAQGADEWREGEGVDDLLLRAAVVAEDCAIAAADGGWGAEQVQGVHVGGVQEISVQIKAGRQQAESVREVVEEEEEINLDVDEHELKRVLVTWI
ncbi:gibberellin 2-beta-dioxygenase-like [Canna indica]|uniref:Gibberellin 2-beta-dioxygenase-like n=1 Tax=Canna indica TaxID=4628 RepID=A0AAQ3QIV4_9LILI|nr:gibberellin 2-beta-dioxygenase-like [Canna indica]